MQNMKSFRSTLFAAFAVLLLAAVAYAQSAVTASDVQKSEVQKSFEALKSLAGSWEGPITVNPLMPGMNEQPIKPMRVTMRVTSRGNAIVHEFQEANTPLDPSRYDHPVTMLYVDAGQLNLVHYCDAGNRPHMTGKVSPDGKTVEFDFADLSGGNQHGHMHHAVFTFIDADHHTEEWTYMMPGDKPIHARMELHRVK
jgi:hypothetical protein